MADDSGPGGAGWDSPKEYFQLVYLTDDNHIRWGALASGVTGGLVAAIFNGFIQLPLSIGAAIQELLTPLQEALQKGGSQLATEIRLASLFSWDPFAFGALSLPVNAAAALLGLFAVSWGWSRYA